MTAPFLPGLRPALSPMGPRSARTLARSCRQATLAQIESRLAPALGPGGLPQPGAGPAFSRERIYTLPRTFWSWVWQVFQANTSCREAVRQAQALFLLRDGRPVKPGTGAYCAARGKLSLSWLEQIFQQVCLACQKTAPASPLLTGRPLRAIDGSGSRLPDTPAHRQAYPPGHEVKGVGFPFLRFTALFCVASGAVLARATGSLRSQEKQHLIALQGALQKGDILIGDRAYGFFVFMAGLTARGVDLIARLSQARRVDFSQAIRSLGPDDALFVWTKGAASKLLSAEDWAALPDQITVRVLRQRVTPKGFRTRELLLATTLLDERNYPRQEILEAYLLRWRMEMCLDDIKTSLGMETLACRSPQMAEKELLLFLIAHNFVRWLMLQAAQEHVPLARLSFKGSLQALGQWSQAMAQLAARRDQTKRARLWASLLDTLRADAVPQRPGRREPRAVKNRPKYDWLTKPRALYQERPSRNQRRRISKAIKRASLK